jgi:UPF0755 protein
MRKVILAIFFIIVIAGLIVGFVLLKYRGKLRGERQAYYERIQKQQAEEIQLRFVEGWTTQQYGKYLEEKGIASSTVISNALKSVKNSDYPILASRPAGFGLEGFLFPDTYQFAKEVTPGAIIDTLLETFRKRWQSVTDKPFNTLLLIPGFESLEIKGERGLSVYQLVTLASIVEKETGRDLTAVSNNTRERLDEERKIVAGIFYNRLLINQALQSDATVNFVTGKSTAAATIEDIQVNSPYNTYIYPGLPPGPIANPSLSSLQAVLHPIKTDYYYFLHKQPSGEIVYSKTFNEHISNKQKYLR